MKGVSEWDKKSDITTAAFPQWTPFSLPPSPLPKYKVVRLLARIRDVLNDAFGSSLKVTMVDPVVVRHTYMSQ